MVASKPPAEADHTTGTPRQPLTDSPWFWAYLFCVFAAGTLMLFGTKMGDRQSQLDEKAFNRQQSAAQQTAGQTGNSSATTGTEESSGDENADSKTGSPNGSSARRPKPIHLPFLPLLAVFLLLTIAGGVGLWWTHFHRR